MKHYIRSIVVMTLFIPLSTFAQGALANDNSNWFVKPNIGISLISDFSVNFSDANNTNENADINTDSGFLAGLGVGYRYNEYLAVEVAWEYRTNDSSVSLANGLVYEDGNYASNTFFINGIYTFGSKGRWKPYLGAGIAWLQEVDIDIEKNESELSYSANGDIGLQVFGGVNYELNNNWDLQAEVRTTSITGIDFEAETSSTGSFSGLDYKPTTVQFAMVYNF